MWYIWFLLRIDDPDKSLTIFNAISKKTFVAMLVLAAVIALFGGLATVAAHGPHCVQDDPIKFYRLDDFAGFFLGCGFMAFMMSAAAWPTPENAERLKQLFAGNTEVVQTSESFQMNGGAASAYCVVFALFGVAVLLTGVAISQSLTILTRCPLVIPLH